MLFHVSALFSLPNKHKSSDSSAGAMNSLGSNLSELDRLLLELNAVQQSTPAFATEGTIMREAHEGAFQFMKCSLMFL